MTLLWHQNDYPKVLIQDQAMGALIPFAIAPVAYENVYDDALSRLNRVRSETETRRSCAAGV